MKLQAVVGLIAVAMLGALGLWLHKSNLAATSSATQLTENNSALTPAGASATDTESGFEKLAGRWVRPDGGYMLEIKSANAQGQLAAGYFNPRSIHVARAEASREGTSIRVFVELRDVNYPGSTYTLVYEPISVLLRGIYFQAVMKEHYDVLFERLR
jgi:hypothetical protein